MDIFGIPLQAFLGQLLLGLVNGSFYAMLSLGLAVIFGLLGIVNFAHGALYMIGAYVAWIGLEFFGINYWLALIVSPLWWAPWASWLSELCSSHSTSSTHSMACY
jgi:branched-chain amino acid transport system permease protein